MDSLTSKSLLSVNPDQCLLVRNKQIILANLTIKSPPIPMQPLHLLLINTFIHAKTLAQGVDDFTQSETAKLLVGEIPKNVVRSRIEQLFSMGVLVIQSAQEENDKPTNIDSGSFINESQTSTPIEHGLYKVHKNLSINITSNGFVVNHVASLPSTIIGLDSIFTLLATVQNANITDSLKYKAPYISESQHWNKIQRLISLSILVEKNKVNVPSVTDKKSSNKVITTFDWKDYPKQEKIPIYFVPHTENHYPLALGLINTAITYYKNGLLLDKYQLVPIRYMEPEQFLSGPYRKYGAGIWLFSNYLWSVETNVALSKFIKQNSPRNITIHGGPSTPDYEQKCEEFLKQNGSIDVAIHAEAEISICEVLELLEQGDAEFYFNTEQLSQVKGISYRTRAQGNFDIIHTDKRTRMKEPDTIHSPYIEGVFDHYGDNVEAAIIESNRGCPFGCTFCDWGSAISQKVRKFDIQRVKQEIEWIARNQTKVLWIADANFGIYDRDIDIASYIIEMKKKYDFPQEVVVNYTKNTTLRLVEIIKIFSEGGIISQGVISIQTMDSQTLEVVSRTNIKLDKYDELRNIFLDLKLPLSTDLMLGLPGTTIDALKSDLQHYFDSDVQIKAYPTQLLPNSPMASPDYIEKYKIKTSDDGYLVSTYSYNEQDLQMMKTLYKVFTMADGYSLFRYVLRYLQWEHDIKALDFLYDLISNLANNQKEFPLLNFAINFFETEKSIPGGWVQFYQEVAKYLNRFYQIDSSSGLNTVLLVSRMAMPEESLIYPTVIELKHDISAYFKVNMNAEQFPKIPLNSFTETQLTFRDSDGLVAIDDTYLQYDSHQFFWELDSNVSRARSAFSF